MLPRLYDVDAGSVTVGGVDVRRLTFASLRRTIGMVTQDGHLFHESIRENLLFAAPEASEDELWAALRGARLEGVVRSLPGGLDTVVGERGYRLSGGERQRLTIARLLLAEPPVVILDEATSSLDSTSEADVQAALTTALEGRTALVIAHRLSTIVAADQILVVEDGRIVGARQPRRAARSRRTLRRPVSHPVPLRRRGPRARHDLSPSLTDGCSGDRSVPQTPIGCSAGDQSHSSL